MMGSTSKPLRTLLAEIRNVVVPHSTWTYSARCQPLAITRRQHCDASTCSDSRKAEGGGGKFTVRSTAQRSLHRWSKSVHHPTRCLRSSMQRALNTPTSPRSSRETLPARNPKSCSKLETNLPEQVRTVLRLLTNPIVVCTATHNGTPRAITISSFTSLTLSPTPVVSFNIATPSRTLDAIMASQELNIHILAADASGVAVANHFTKGNADYVFQSIDGVIDGVTCSVSEDGRHSAPLIQSQGVLRVLRCKLLREEKMNGLVRVRDHVIVVGEVMEIIPEAQKQEFALAYADRQYRREGIVIDHER